MKIAALVDEKGACLPLYSQGKIRLYSDEGGHWLPVLDLLFELGSEQSLELVREKLMGVLGRLAKEGCADLIARSVRGFPLSIVDGMGFEMWRLDGAPEAYLDLIREQRQQACQHQESPLFSPDPEAPDREPQAGSLPLPVSDDQPGHYRINLIRSLAISGMTSKQLLLPFIRESQFCQLEVICDHLPKWFERELASHGMTFTISTNEDGILHLVLKPAAATPSAKQAF